MNMYMEFFHRLHETGSSSASARARGPGLGEGTATRPGGVDDLLRPRGGCGPTDSGRARRSRSPENWEPKETSKTHPALQVGQELGRSGTV